MKKLFVALMAVLVLASCGKKEAPVQKSEADVMVMTADIMNSTAAKLESAATADEVIDVMASMVADVHKMEDEFGELVDSINGLNETDLYEKFPKEMELVEAANQKFSDAIIAKEEVMKDITPEQQLRLVEVLQSLE
jgi:hypothetical protein